LKHSKTTSCQLSLCEGGFYYVPGAHSLPSTAGLTTSAKFTADTQTVQCVGCLMASTDMNQNTFIAELSGSYFGHVV